MRLPNLSQRTSLIAGILLITAVILACGTDAQSEVGRVIILTRLPTLTPTVGAVMDSAPEAESALPEVAQAAPPAPTPQGAPATAPTDVPPPPAQQAAAASPLEPSSPNQETTDPPAPTAIVAEIEPTPEPVQHTPGWSFAGVQIVPNPYEDGLLLYGDMINGTGTAQELSLVTGTFYDSQGQVVAGQDNTVDYWPIDIVPTEGRVPFELTVLDAQNVANYKLIVQAQPSDRAPQQQFEFLNVAPWSEEGIYCLQGTLKNPGDPVHDYAVIVAVVYDSQDNIISFGEHYEPEPENGLSGTPLEFEVCAELVSPDIARYELRAWGE